MMALLAAQPCMAGAWLQEQGSGQVIFGTTAAIAYRWYDHKGKARPAGVFQKQENAIIIDYGLTDDISILAGAQMQRQVIPTVDWQLQAGGLSGMFGGKLRLWQKEAFVMSVEASIQAASERIMADYSPKLEAPVQAELRINAGYNLHTGDMPAFVDLQGAYRWRGGGNADSVHIDMTLGVRPIPDLLVMLQSFNAIASSSNRPSGSRRSRQHKLQPSFVYRFSDNWSVQLGGFFGLKGRNTVNEQGIILALWRRV